MKPTPLILISLLCIGCGDPAAITRLECARWSGFATTSAQGAYRSAGEFAPPGDYVSAVAASTGATPAAQGFVLWLEVYDATSSAPLPREVAFDRRRGYDGCEVCAGLSSGCREDGSGCAHDFLAVSGALALSRADRSSRGALEAEATAVQFLEWDLQADRPVPGGRCIEVAPARWDARWGQ